MTETAVSRPASSRTVEFAVETNGLRKTYRSRRGPQVAVAELDLRVPNGGVHGFLGPNGSGKTTTIRMLLGLIRADAGEMRIFDAVVPRALPSVIGRVGAIVEQPRFFPAFSGRKNLELLAQAIRAPHTRVAEVLDEVGLGDRGRDRFRTYSLGMKQRLAIAGTLLKDPELLIFDEPTNGLDPAGIHEIRATMRGLADRGKTVLVSSHILSEVQQVADTVSIIGRGRLLASGQVQEILAAADTQTVRVGVSDPQRAHQVLVAAGFVVVPNPPMLTVGVRDTSARFDFSRITRVLAQHDLYVSELTPVRADLESVFLGLTAEEHLGATSHPGQQPPPPPGPTPPRPGPIDRPPAPRPGPDPTPGAPR
jgi:ABC-type multidrug transport system ATPase subunit